MKKLIKINLIPFTCSSSDRPILSPAPHQSSAACGRCVTRRTERRDVVAELYETELKYGRDLRIVVEEFYRPMLVAGLLNSDQLAGIFLNVEELIQVSKKEKRGLSIMEKERVYE